MTATSIRLYPAIVRFASGEAVDLRTRDAETTFATVCDAAARRGPVVLIVTATRELAVILGVIALARIRPLVPRRRPRLPDLADSLHSLHIGARSLVRSHPGYLAMAIFVLAVAVGVNLLVFTIVNALWIRPMPFPDPERVVAPPGFSGARRGEQADCGSPPV